MKIKILFVGGIIGIAVVAGVFQALATPRTGNQKEHEKEEEKGDTPESN